MNLAALLDAQGEDATTNLLRSFSCPLNADIELFARERAIDFSKRGIARTHLVFEESRDGLLLAGFFTLTIKVLSIKADILSATTRKRLLRFARFNESARSIEMPAPLIAQLGRNYSSRAGFIPGDELLSLACKKVSDIQFDLGGKLVYLECEPRAKLVEFYERNDFHQIETTRDNRENLLTMMTYLG